MRANEISVGDWVYCTFSDKPCKVLGIEEYEDTDYANVKVTNVVGAKDIASLTPIPLTVELLEKNDFVKFIAGQHILSKRDDNYFLSIFTDLSTAPNSNGKMAVCVKNGYTDTKIAITYLHELQHVLKLCGINKELIA